MYHTRIGEGEKMSNIKGGKSGGGKQRAMRARARGYLEGLEAAAVELQDVRAELEATRRRERRAVGVVSDVDRTRGEAAAVLDDYAAEHSTSSRRPPAGLEGIQAELEEHADRLAELEKRANQLGEGYFTEAVRAADLAAELANRPKPPPANAPPDRCPVFGNFRDVIDGSTAVCARDRGHPNDDGEGGHRADP